LPFLTGNEEIPHTCNSIHSQETTLGKMWSQLLVPLSICRITRKTVPYHPMPYHWANHSK